MAFIYNLSDTWNDAATTWNGIKLAVTNTASSASSNLLNLTVTGATTASFVVDKSGNLALNGTVNKITFTAPATGATLTLADNSTFITSGAYSSTFTFSGTTTLTFPTSGTVTALGNTTTGSGAIVLATGPSITLTNATGLPLATGVTGTLPIANGGTGQTTANAAFNALVPSQGGNNGKYLTTDGSNTSWATNPLGTVTSVDVSGGSTGLSFSGGPITTSGTITMAGTLAAANGGTGLTSLGTGIATWLGTPSSANLASAVTDETGSGPLVFATSPTFTSAVTLGAQQTTQGSLVLANTAAGSYSTTIESSNSASAAWTLTLPSTAGTNGYVLATDGVGNTSWVVGGGGGGGSVAGSDKQIQFNDAGSFGASANFLFDKTTYTMTLGLASTATGVLALGNASSANLTKIQAGNASAAVTYTLPTAAPASNGYALTSTTAGVLSWTALASGTINTGTVGQITYYSGTNTLSGTTTGTGVLTALGNNTNVAGGVLVPAAALTTNALVVGGGSGTGPSTVTTGTGVVTALGVNTGSAGAFVVNGGALGTPSSGNLSSCTNVPVNQATGTLPVANGGTGLTSGTSGGVLYYSATGTLASSSALAANALVVGGGAGVAPSTTTTASEILTFLGTPSSANLAAAVTDETGTGALVFGTSPTFTTSAIFPAGTVSAPGITTTGDTNTGIYFPAADTIAVTTNGTEDMRFTPQNNVTLNSATFSPTTPSTAGNMAMTGTLAMGSSFKRNRLINGNMYIAQRATSATVTAGTAVPTASTGYPCVDRWFVYSTGANVTAAQVAGTGSNKNLLQITGAASVTAVGVGQRIEQLNSIDMAGQTATLSVELANSLLTTVTWTASYATTADTFGTIGTPTKTQIATGTFTVTSTLTRYTTNITIPAAATTGIEILFTVGAQTSGTWDVNNVQLEVGSISTPYERQIYSDQLAQCQRYYQITAQLSGATPSATTVNAWGTISPTMRVAPTLGQTGVLNFQGDGTNNANQSATGLGSNFSTAYAILLLGVPNFAGLTTSRPGTLAVPGSNSNYITMSAEL
jgi:hypothetical protein